MNTALLIRYLNELAQNNNRPWFAHNKPTYDIVLEQFAALVSETIPLVTKFDPQLGPVEAKKAVFRIYRDVRFAKDKSPYKTHFSALIGDRKRQDAAPWYYFQIDHKGTLMLGGGLYQPDKDAIKKIRDHMVEHPRSLDKLLRNKKFMATYGGLADEDKMVRPPKTYDAGHRHIEAIKNRHFIGITEINLKKHKTDNLAKDIAGMFRDVHPLVVWLREALA